MESSFSQPLADARVAGTNVAAATASKNGTVQFCFMAASIGVRAAYRSRPEHSPALPPSATARIHYLPCVGPLLYLNLKPWPQRLTTQRGGDRGQGYRKLLARLREPIEDDPTTV